jgi:predicted Zn-dependent protease
MSRSMNPMRSRPFTLRNIPRAGRVLSRAEATALATKLLGMVSDRSVGVLIEHAALDLTTIANNKIVGSDDGDELTISFDSKFGSGLPVTIGTNQLDEATLRRVIEEAKGIETPLPLAEDAEPDDPDDPKYHTYDKREYLPVSLWHDTTISAMDSVRGEVAPQLVEQVKKANLIGAATVGLTARSSLYMYQPGLTAWSQETDCELTMTARTADGTASGWAGQANRDWSKIDPAAVAAAAIDLANRGKNPVAIEPGHRTAILAPAAVAQIVRLMAPMFDAYQTDHNHTPFSLRSMTGKTNKLGLQVFDPRLLMVSDPADPEGGFPPFFEANTSGGIAGLPLPKMTWVEGGILKNLAYEWWYGLAKGKDWCEQPFSVRLGPMAGTTTSTIEQMIAACKDGIYVSRFSDVSIVDRKTGVMTGMTRDGCFHIKAGKIDRPANNYRFTESPFFVFNKLKMIGVPQRAAFGYTPPQPSDFDNFGAWPPPGRATRWPLAPTIVPPMMIEDFSFTALADAV